MCDKKFEMQTFDVAQLRAETPGTQHVIHFNNAGASLMPEKVSHIMHKYMQDETTFGGYEMEDRYSPESEKVYDLFAQLLNCKSNEIAITDSATTAWDRAFYSLPLNRDDKILTSVGEYASNYIAYLQVAKRKGVCVKIIPNDEYGQISIEALKNMIDETVKLISISHIPTNSGLVNPAEDIGKIAQKHNIWYLIDACQSVGQIPLDIQKLGCDMLSGTGRKFLRGPRGTGFLFVSEKMLQILEPFSLDLHSAEWTQIDQYQLRMDARVFETSEFNIAAKLGLASAVQYALDVGIESTWKRIQQLANIFRDKLSTINRVQVQDLGQVKCGIVTFTVEEADIFQLRNEFRRRNINTSVSVRHHTLIDMTQRNLNNMIRASVHYFNTEDEIDVFCQTLKEIVSE